MSRSQRNRKIGTAVTVTGILLLLAAIGLTLFNLWDESKAGQAAAGALDGILQEMENEGDSPEVSAWSQEAEMPVAELDGAAYLGILEIPALALALPVRDTWSYPNLRKTPCRYTGGLYAGNMVIAGHNYDSHFGRLKELKAGDEVLFTDMDKNQTAYRVTEVDTLAPEAIEEMTGEGPWDLTLFTCTIGGRSRVTVRCVLQDIQEDKDNLQS